MAQYGLFHELLGRPAAGVCRGIHYHLGGRTRHERSGLEIVVPFAGCGRFDAADCNVACGRWLSLFSEVRTIC